MKILNLTIAILLCTLFLEINMTDASAQIFGDDHANHVANNQIAATSDAGLAANQAD